AVERKRHGDRPAAAESLAHGRRGNGAQLAVNGIGESDLSKKCALTPILQSLGDEEQRADAGEGNEKHYRRGQQEGHQSASLYLLGHGRPTGVKARRTADADGGGSSSRAGGPRIRRGRASRRA